jgi:hypothetical protein
MLTRFWSHLLSAALGVLGCSGVVASSSEPQAVGASAGNPSSPHSGSGGAERTDTSGSGGALEGGGSLSGCIGGPCVASGGATGSGAAATRGGATAAGGAVGAGGLGGGGSGGATGNASAPTFTMIYDSIITKSCGGSQCHLQRPTPFGYDFSSKSAASASWRSDVIPYDGASSPMFQVLNFGLMPKDRPQLSLEQLYLVYDWINAGALDN